MAMRGLRSSHQYCDFTVPYVDSRVQDDPNVAVIDSNVMTDSLNHTLAGNVCNSVLEPQGNIGETTDATDEGGHSEFYPDVDPIADRMRANFQAPLDNFLRTGFDSSPSGPTK